MTQFKSDSATTYRRKSSGNNTPFLIAKEARNSADATLSNLSTCKQGLTNSDVEHRLQEHGLNQVSHEKAPNVFVQLFMAFNNPFIYVLIILAIISDITNYWIPKEHGEPTSISSVVIIVTMVSLSAALRFIQEFRTNKAAEALKSMVRTTATVRRRAHKDAQDEVIEIPLQQLVPGDIIHLTPGDMIPADIKLLEARDLFISQAVLTGESIPVEKTDTPLDALNDAGDVTQGHNDSSHESELIELPNVCLMGTNVSSGTATAVVVATGPQTYFGSLAKSIVGTRSQTAFDRGVNSVSWLLIRFMLVMVPIVLLINGFTKHNWVDAALFALSVAVGLTPEMLPMIVSSNLAKGAIMMARRKVVVKHLNAIQNFGAMDVLCTDKTGTLTQDRIILEHHTNVQGSNDEHVLALAWLNSHHQSGLKNLMDKAVLHFAKGNPTIEHLGRFHKVDELPFDFVRRRLSIVVGDENDNHTLICKGAVEEMLSISTHIQENGQVLELNAERRNELLALTEKYNKQGFRVLLVGTRDLGVKGCTLPLEKDDERDLVVHGLLTFLDPPKESAITAIAALRENGVMVKVLTGDNPVVTSKICRDVGLEPGEPLLGTDIELLSDSALAQLVEQRTIFAKLTPLQKSRVLKMLQNNGHTVGFLGDGINDAPALRDADVGISVDTGTDIAKESADIILLEKNLMVLEEGVLKGRETFGNIMKYLNMTASSNFGNVFSVLIASIFLPFLPMLPIQILIQNLLYDISQLALPWDRMDKEFLRKPRKWDAENIGRFMVWLGPTSSIFDVTTFLLMWFVFKADSSAHQALFHSAWFVEGLLSQTLVIHMLRTRKIPFIQSTAALPVLLATVVVVALGVYLPFSPLGPLVGLKALPWQYFPWLVATLLCYCLLAQGMKRFYIRRFGRWF